MTLSSTASHADTAAEEKIQASLTAELLSSSRNRADENQDPSSPPPSGDDEIYDPRSRIFVRSPSPQGAPHLGRIFRPYYHGHVTPGNWMLWPDRPPDLPAIPGRGTLNPQNIQPGDPGLPHFLRRYFSTLANKGKLFENTVKLHNDNINELDASENYLLELEQGVLDQQNQQNQPVEEENPLLPLHSCTSDCFSYTYQSDCSGQELDDIEDEAVLAAKEPHDMPKKSGTKAPPSGRGSSARGSLRRSRGRGGARGGGSKKEETAASSQGAGFAQTEDEGTGNPLASSPARDVIMVDGGLSRPNGSIDGVAPGHHVNSSPHKGLVQGSVVGLEDPFVDPPQGVRAGPHQTPSASTRRDPLGRSSQDSFPVPASGQPAGHSSLFAAPRGVPLPTDPSYGYPEPSQRAFAGSFHPGLVHHPQAAALYLGAGHQYANATGLMGAPGMTGQQVAPHPLVGYAPQGNFNPGLTTNAGNQPFRFPEMENTFFDAAVARDTRFRSMEEQAQMAKENTLYDPDHAANWLVGAGEPVQSGNVILGWPEQDHTRMGALRRAASEHHEQPRAKVPRYADPEQAVAFDNSARYEPGAQRMQDADGDQEPLAQEPPTQQPSAQELTPAQELRAQEPTVQEPPTDEASDQAQATPAKSGRGRGNGRGRRGGRGRGSQKQKRK